VAPGYFSAVLRMIRRLYVIGLVWTDRRGRDADPQTRCLLTPKPRFHQLRAATSPAAMLRQRDESAQRVPIVITRFACELSPAESTAVSVSV
jgi:hypothetical protein